MDIQNRYTAGAIARTRMLSKLTSLPYFVICVLGFTSLLFHASESIETTSYSSSGKTTRVRREGNLDHWDSDTLAYHLDEKYPGYDVAIMFYASWDTNSHTLAPYWDKVATSFKAGESQSRLIMALFDCELNTAHAQLCEAINIKLYPTLMFIGSGPLYDTDPFTKAIFGSRSAGPYYDSPVPRTIKFQGDWRYPQIIADWIEIMQKLSTWHLRSEGFGSFFRRLFFPQSQHGIPLPVGVPRDSMSLSGTGNNINGGIAGSTGKSSSGETQQLEAQVAEYENVAKELEKLATRSATMMESVLFATDPSLTNGNGTVDMFQLLAQEKAWTNTETNTPEVEIYRNCVIEVSLDYCQRVAQRVGSRIVDTLDINSMSDEELSQALSGIESKILEQLSTSESYCGIIEDCIANNFVNQACTPSTCPFNNEAACHYLTSCMDPQIEEDYAKALGLALTSHGSSASGNDDAGSEASGSKKKGWNLF